MTLHFEDLDTETRFDLGEATLTEAEIVDFAERFDPHPFHVDPDVGDDSPFGGLVASGLHTYCVCNRLATDALFGELAFLGGMGVEELRWHRPVRPGDTLTGTTGVVDRRASESHPERGYADLYTEGVNADGERVISWTALGMVRRRDAAAEEPREVAAGGESRE